MQDQQHLTSHNVVAKNSLRTVFVSPREKGGLPKGNRDSSYLGSCEPVADETARWGAVRPFTNEVRDYVPTPAPAPAVWDGKVSRAKFGPEKVVKANRLRTSAEGTVIDTGKVKKARRVSVANAPKAGRRGVPGSKFR